jgi:hypothetical protein
MSANETGPPQIYLMVLSLAFSHSGIRPFANSLAARGRLELPRP